MYSFSQKIDLVSEESRFYMRTIVSSQDDAHSHTLCLDSNFCSVCHLNIMKTQVSYKISDFIRSQNG